MHPYHSTLMGDATGLMQQTGGEEVVNTGEEKDHPFYETDYLRGQTGSGGSQDVFLIQLTGAALVTWWIITR